MTFTELESDHGAALLFMVDLSSPMFPGEVNKLFYIFYLSHISFPE